MVLELHDPPVDINGVWHLTWRPEMAPRQTGDLTVTTEDSLVAVALTSSVGDASGTGSFEGSTLRCTLSFEGGRPALELEASVLEDGQLEGVVRRAGPPSPLHKPSSLEGVRSGSNLPVRSREGSDAVAETLKKAGVECVFGYLGGATSVMHRSVLSHDIRNIAARTELSAAWMSYGYNRVKNRAASSVLVWCVGALHASPVVYAAKMDSTPLVLMTMESAPAWDLRDILQDAGELTPALKPISKYIKKIVDGEDAPLAVRQAVLAASTGKFGPAVLNLTHTAMLQRTTVKSEELVLPSRPAASQRDVGRAMELLQQAEKPVILVGAGVHMADATSELRAFAEASGIPVVSSGIGGRGVLPDDHPLYAGGVGLMEAANSGAAVADDADLWIALGYSFSQTATFSWSTPKPSTVIHVDIEENQIGRVFQPTLGVVADVKEFLLQMTEALGEQEVAPRAASPDPRLAAIAAAKEGMFGMLASAMGQEPVTPLTIGATLAHEVPNDTLVVGDEGFMVPGMVYKQDKYPSGMAPAIGAHYMSLGSSLPVAIGAKFAAPDRLVVSYTGDAGFYYNSSDLSTLAEHNLKVVVIINNNGGLFGGKSAREAGVGPAGMMGDNPWLDLPEGMDFVGVGKSLGVDGEGVDKAEDLAPALRRAIEADGPYLIDVKTDGAATYGGMEAAMTGMDLPEKLGHLDRVVDGSWPS